MKWLYNQYAKDVPPYKGSVPEYPTWFESSVMQWLNENDDVSLEYLNGAFARDKKDGVSVGEQSVAAGHIAGLLAEGHRPRGQLIGDGTDGMGDGRWEMLVRVTWPGRMSCVRHKDLRGECIYNTGGTLFLVKHLYNAFIGPSFVRHHILN